MPAGRRPDILIIMADQLVPSALPFHGNPVTRAPALSGLAESGVVFDAAYTASPLCAPARASLMTGLLPSRTGAYDNAARVQLRDPDLRPLPAAGRLPHRAVRQDALLRPGPAARVRGAAHHRHLSGRLRLDAGLGPPARAPQLVPRHVVGHRRRAVRAVQPAGLRRRGGVRGRAVAVRAHPLGRRAPVLLRGLVQPSARPVHDPAEVVGPLPRRGHPDARRRAGRGRRCTRTSAGSARSARWTAWRSPRTRSAPRGAPTTARSPTSTTRSSRLIGVLRDTGRLDGHRRHRHQRPRRDARRARGLVQDELLRGRGPRAADRQRARAASRRAGWRPRCPRWTCCRPWSAWPTTATRPASSARWTAGACCRTCRAPPTATRWWRSTWPRGRSRRSS